MKNFKQICAKATIPLLLATSFSWAAGDVSQDIKIMIDGQQQLFDVQPVIQNGRTLAPMRGIFEAMGASLTWDEETKTVKAEKEDTKVSVTIGSYLGEKDGESIKLDAQPVIIEDRTMVPLRFISESLGAEVEWNDVDRKVIITTEKSNGEDSISEEDSTKVDDNILTYEEALDKALNSSYDYKNAQEALNKVEEQYNNVILIPGRYNSLLIQKKKSLELAKKWAEKQTEIAKEGIEYSVENSMKNLKQALKEKALAEEKLEYSLEQIKIKKLKKETGLESEYNLNMVEQSHEQKVKELDVANTSVNSAYVELNQLIGVPSTDRYDVDIEISYNPTAEVDVDDVVRRELNSNPHIWYQKESVDLAELGVSLYEYNAGLGSYKEKEIDVRTAKNTLANIKSKLEESLRLRYDKIKQIEENYKVLEINLDKAKKSFNLVKSQYDVGMAIETQLNEAKLAVDEVMVNMQELALQHDQLVTLLNKPYLNPDYK